MAGISALRSVLSVPKASHRETGQTAETEAARPVQRSKWNKNFDLRKAPKIWQALENSGANDGAFVKGRPKSQRKAGQNRPGSFALDLFKASAPRLHQSNER